MAERTCITWRTLMRNAAGYHQLANHQLARPLIRTGLKGSARVTNAGVVVQGGEEREDFPSRSRPITTYALFSGP